MSMCMSIAQARTKPRPKFWGAIFSCKFSRKRALVTCPCAFRLHRLAQNVGSQALGLRHLHGKFSHKRALVEILLSSSEILVWSFKALAWGACAMSESCCDSSCGRFLYQDLVRSAPAAGPFVTILWDLGVLAWRSCEKAFTNSVCEALAVTCWQRPLHGVVYRSLWEALVEILLKSSGGPWIQILQILCIAACMKVFLGCS